MTLLGDRRAAVSSIDAADGVPDRSARAVYVVASVLQASKGWRYHPGDVIELVDGRPTFPLVLADGTVAGVGERYDEERDDERDLAVEAMLALFDAVVDAERAALEAAAAAAQARVDAVHDHLTGLLNRRGWEQALDQEGSRASRRPSAWVVAVVDIDHLKETNDLGGHLEGDLLLKLAADTIAGSVRANDVVARIGGDEFAVLGLDYAPPDAEPLIDRIQHGLAGAGVDASVGASVHEADKPLAKTFQRADSAMYEEKRRRALTRS